MATSELVMLATSETLTIIKSKLETLRNFVELILIDT